MIFLVIVSVFVFLDFIHIYLDVVDDILQMKVSHIAGYYQFKERLNRMKQVKGVWADFVKDAVA